MSDQPPPPGFSPPNQPSGFAPPPGVGQPPPGAPSFGPPPPPASAGDPGGFGPGGHTGPGGPAMVPVQPPPERGPRSKVPLVIAVAVIAVVAITVGVVLAATSGDDGKQTGGTTENTSITPRTGRVTTIADTRPTTPATDATDETGPRFSIPPLTDPRVSQTTTARTTGAPTTRPSATTAPANAAQPVGATITSTPDHLAVTVLDVVDNAPPGEFSEPDAGNKFVAVRVHVANTGAEPANTFASVSAKLIDSAGQQFGQAFVDANVGPTFFVLTIPGNDVRAGWLTFEIPEGSTPQRFQWELDDDTAEWDLTAARQEPSGLAQPIAAKVPVGTAAMVTGNDEIPFELTVNQVVDNAEPEFGQAADGNRFIAVQVTYRNVGNASISEFAEAELELVDPDGQQWGASFLGSNAGPGFDGEIKLAPGDTRTGFVSFEIPQGMTPLKLAAYVGTDSDVASFALA